MKKYNPYWKRSGYMNEEKVSYLWVRMDVVRTKCNITLFSNNS